jgi:hypothetical protein
MQAIQGTGTWHWDLAHLDTILLCNANEASTSFDASNAYSLPFTVSCIHLLQASATSLAAFWSISSHLLALPSKGLVRVNVNPAPVLVGVDQEGPSLEIKLPSSLDAQIYHEKFGITGQGMERDISDAENTPTGCYDQ